MNKELKDFLKQSLEYEIRASKRKSAINNQMFVIAILSFLLIFLCVVFL